MQRDTHAKDAAFYFDLPNHLAVLSAVAETHKLVLLPAEATSGPNQAGLALAFKDDNRFTALKVAIANYNHLGLSFAQI